MNLIQSFKRRARRFWVEESGPTIVEYAVLLSLVVIVSIGVLTAIGVKMRTIFTTVGNGMPDGS